MLTTYELVPLGEDYHQLLPAKLPESFPYTSMDECKEKFYQQMCNLWQDPDPGPAEAFRPTSKDEIRTYTPQQQSSVPDAWTQGPQGLEYTGIGLLDCHGVTVVPQQISADLRLRKDGRTYQIQCILGYGSGASEGGTILKEYSPGGLHFDFYAAIVSRM